MAIVQLEAEMENRVRAFLREHSVFILGLRPLEDREAYDLDKLIEGVDPYMGGRRLALELIEYAVQRGIPVSYRVISKFCAFNRRDMPEHNLDLERLRAESIASPQELVEWMRCAGEKSPLQLRAIAFNRAAHFSGLEGWVQVTRQCLEYEPVAMAILRGFRNARASPEEFVAAARELRKIGVATGYKVAVYCACICDERARSTAV